MLRAQRSDISSISPPSTSARDHAAHVVDLRALRSGTISAGSCAGTGAGRPCGGRLAGALGQVGEQLAHEADRVAVVVGHELADAVLRVHARAAEPGGVDVLAHDLAHHARAR